MDGYLLFIACILGLVEGLTEFLPISSTLHMFVVGNLLGLNDSKMMFLLCVVLQLGAIFSVVVFFWNHFFILIKRIYCIDFSFFDRSCLDFGHIVLGLLPTIVLGSFFYECIRSLFSIQYMFYALIFGSIFLLISEWFARRFYIYKNSTFDINDLSYLQAFLIGCFQCLALFPGFSRSGATISGGLLVGLDRYASSVFSFLLGTPIIFSATVLSLYKNFYFVYLDYLPVFIVGFLSAFIVSLFTVKIFMRIIQYVSFVPFVIYRFVLAFLIYFFYI